MQGLPGGTAGHKNDGLTIATGSAGAGQVTDGEVLKVPEMQVGRVWLDRYKYTMSCILYRGVINRKIKDFISY